MVRAIILAAALALTIAAPAPAAEIVARAAPGAGPVIAGKLVEWTTGGGTRALVVRAATRGGRPRIALRVGAPRAGRRRTVTTLIATGSRVELAYRTARTGTTACQPHTSTLAIALPSSGVAALERDATCIAGSPGAYRVVIHRSHGAALVLAEGSARLDHLTAAGRYVAWQQAGTAAGGDPITVYDLVRRSVVVTIADPSLTLAHDQLAIDSSGRLAAAVYDPSASTIGPRYDLEWWGPGRHTAHQLPGLFATGAPIRFQAGHVAFEQATGFGATALTLSDLAGRTVEVARFRRGGAVLRGFDYEGRTVAWAQRGPGGRALILRTSVRAGTG